MSNSYLLVAGKAGAELGGSAQSWSLSAPVGLSLPRIVGTFDAMVKATEDMQRADSQIEACMRRVERSLTEADKELVFRADSQQVFAEVSGGFPDTINGQKAPSPSGFYFKVGTHGGSKGTNSLYRNEEGVWLYYEEDAWYVDAGKYPGDGKRSESYFFKTKMAPNEHAPMGAYDANGAQIKASFTLKMQPMASPEICVNGEDREFKVQSNEKWIGVDEALAKRSWAGGQGAWDEAKFSTRLPVLDLLSEMSKQAAEYDDTFKAFNQKYNEDKNKKTALVVKDTLSHATRDLIDVLTPSTVKASPQPDVTDDFIETNSLTSVICVVPQGGDKEFLNWYECGGAGVAREKRVADEKKAAEVASGKVQDAEAEGVDETSRMLKKVEKLNKEAADMDPVIPRSAKKLNIKEDKDGLSLWRVVVFHKDYNKVDKHGEYEARKEGPANAFTKACRDSKYIVRDYKFSPQIFAKSIAERELALGNWTISHVGLLKTGTKSFAALFDIWMHMKILRLAVEATLRYGSVDQCGAHLLCPNPAKIVELRKALSSQISNKHDLSMLDVEDEDAAADNFPYCNVALTPLTVK